MSVQGRLKKRGRHPLGPAFCPKLNIRETYRPRPGPLTFLNPPRLFSGCRSAAARFAPLTGRFRVMLMSCGPDCESKYPARDNPKPHISGRASPYPKFNLTKGIG